MWPLQLLYSFLLAQHTNLAADVAKSDVVCRAHEGGTLEPVQAVAYMLCAHDSYSYNLSIPVQKVRRLSTVPIASHIPYFKAFLKEIYCREEIG